MVGVFSGEELPTDVIGLAKPSGTLSSPPKVRYINLITYIDTCDYGWRY